MAAEGMLRTKQTYSQHSVIEGGKNTFEEEKKVM